jgi:CrcB protein
VPLPVYARALVGVGFCGALTTFSTLMAELMAMLRGSHWALAGGYAAASVLGGLAAVALATQVAERVRRAP